MAALITGIIPPAQFEAIRDRLGEILATELHNQFVLTAGATPDVKVWVERFVPLDKTEVPGITIQLLSANYSSQNIIDVVGDYTFGIDVYTASPFSASAHGDTLAAGKQQTLLRLVRAILENPIYKTLNFQAPSISSVAVTSFDIGTPQDIADATSTTQARLTVAVRATESVQLLSAPIVAESNTRVYLQETEQGYYYGASGGANPIIIIDSDRLPETSVKVVGLYLGSAFFLINKYFSGRAALVAYLNSTFVPAHSLLGTFSVSGVYIVYSNPEYFLSAEIMAILGTGVLVYQFGDGGGQVPNYPIEAILSNTTNTIPSSPALAAASIVSVELNDSNISYTVENIVPGPGNSLTFTSQPKDCLVFVQLSDLPLTGGGVNAAWQTLTADATITSAGNYAIDANAGDITIALANGISGEIRVKRVDSSANIVMLSGSLEGYTSGEVRFYAHQEIAFSWYPSQSLYLLT